MRSRATWLLAVGVAIVLAACGPRTRPPVVTPGAGGRALGGPVRLGGDGRVRAVPLEGYVAGCVAAELGTPRADRKGADAARAVQAILCRSFAVTARNRHGARGFDLCATTHCQLYRPAPADGIGDLARAAADATRGLVLTYRGTAVRPLYHAQCGGRTSAADSVWPGPGAPWLVSRPDEGCERDAGWQFSVPLDALGRAVSDAGHPDFRPPLQTVAVARRDAAGRAASVRLVGRATIEVSGDVFRAAAMRAFGSGSIKSTLFTVRAGTGSAVFEGRGNGHGVGLCQAGALRRAARGESVEAILRYYFPGTALAHVD